MRKFFILLKKELRELVTVQMLVPLIMVVIVFMFVGKVIGSEQAKSTQAQMNVAMWDRDQSTASAKVQDIFRQKNFNVDQVSGSNEQDVLKKVKDHGLNSLVVIPKGFGASIGGEQSKIQIFTVMKNLSLTGVRTYAPVQAALSAVNEAFSNDLIANKAKGLTAAQVKNPIGTSDVTVVGDKQAEINPAVISGFVSSQTTFIPIILFMVITFSSQLVAVAMASEKENKTLETLLSTPVSRNAIVSAKLIAAGVVSLIMSSFYLFGLSAYMKGIIGDTGAGGAVKSAAMQLGLTFSSYDYFLLGLSLFLGILVALAIALILGSFAEDVKSAQGLMAPMMAFILIPYILTMLVDVSGMSPAMQWFIRLIPFSHPFLAAPNLLLKNYYPVFLGIGYMLLVFVIFVFIAARIFSKDKVLLMKINLKKKK